MPLCTVNGPKAHIISQSQPQSKSKSKLYNGSCVGGGSGSLALDSRFTPTTFTAPPGTGFCRGGAPQRRLADGTPRVGPAAGPLLDRRTPFALMWTPFPERPTRSHHLRLGPASSGKHKLGCNSAKGRHRLSIATPQMGFLEPSPLPYNPLPSDPLPCGPAARDRFRKTTAALLLPPASPTKPTPRGTHRPSQHRSESPTQRKSGNGLGVWRGEGARRGGFSTLPSPLFGEFPRPTFPRMCPSNPIIMQRFKDVSVE